MTYGTSFFYLLGGLLANSNKHIRLIKVKETNLEAKTKWQIFELALFLNLGDDGTLLLT